MKGKQGTEKRLDIQVVAYTVALIAGAIGLIVLSSMLLPGIGRAINHPEFRPSAPPPEDLAPFQNLLLPISLSLFNVALVIYLLHIYVKDYLSIKSNFTLGMVAFLFSFLLYALSSSPLMHEVLGPYGVASKLSFVPMLFSAVCLLIFAKLSDE
jgi:hypothetical protein